MPAQIAPIAQGQTITAAWLNLIVAAVNAFLRLDFTKGAGRVVWGDVNVLLDLNDSAFGAGGGGLSRAGGFMCEVSGSGIRVYLGLVNSIAPEGMTLGDVAPFVIAPIGDAGRVCIEVEVYDESGDSSDSGDGGDGGASGTPGDIHKVKIKCFADGDSASDDTDTKFYLAIGTYGHLAGTLLVTPGGQGNGVGDQMFDLCGGPGGNALWGPA